MTTAALLAAAEDTELAAKIVLLFTGFALGLLALRLR